MIRLSLLQRGGNRFNHGTKQHGRGNWRRALQSPIDIQFLRDRWNHALEHMYYLIQPTGDPDIDSQDHIGAILWFLNLADEVESMGINWADLCKVVTPEQTPIHESLIRQMAHSSNPLE